MEKIIQTLIDSWTKGVDTYTHNGSTWLIFTESKQWVIELTDSKTLWYNYNFFKQIFEFTSLDVVDNQSYITKWVEDNIINGSKNTPSPAQTPSHNVAEVLENGSIDSVRVNEYSLNYVSKQRGCEDTIENGVKETSHNATMFQSMKVEDTIQNGVKSTISTLRPTLFGVDDIIQDGIKETRLEMNITEGEVDDIIQDGVKYTITSELRSNLTAENIIENGVKHTEIGWHQCNNIDDAIENGVKETMSNQGHKPLTVKNIIENGVRHTLNTEYMPTSMVEDIIQSGVKHTEYGDWLDGDERLDDIVENGVKKTSLKRGTRPFMVKDTIKNGVKETNPVDVMKFFDNKMEDALQNGVKETLRASYLNVDNVIQDGVKETNYDTDNYTDDVKEVIREGVKETKTPGKDGDILSTIEWMEENKSTSYTKMIDDVIDNGVKEIKTPNKDGDIQSTLEWMYKNNYQDDYNGSKMINNVIDNGEKINGTYAGGQRQSIKCKSVVEYGTKNPTD